MDALVQQSFMEIQSMNSACCLRNLKDDDAFVQEKLLSLFSLIKKNYHSFLTSEQMKEVDLAINSFSFNEMKTTKEQSMPRNIKGCFPTSMPLQLPISVERKQTAIMNNENYMRTNALLKNPKKHKPSDQSLLNEHVSKRPKSEILQPKAMLLNVDVDVTANMLNVASSKTSKVLQIQQHKYLDSNHNIGKIQLKPRDPRRILFKHNMQKNRNNFHQVTSNVIGTKVHPSSPSKLCSDVIKQDKEKEMEEQNKFCASHKLCLVLDLDHTLLNSVKFEELDHIYNEKMRKIEEKERGKPQQQLFRLDHMHLWTKLRPGVRNFLEKASELYELYVYTMGTKSYAEEMTKILDPTGSLFGGRIISRENNNDLNKDLNKVSRMASSVLIMDDTLEVWPHNKPNVIVVQRYIYFPNRQHKFGHRKPSLFEVGHDERADSGTLASILMVIERVHRNFFSHDSPNGTDVRKILALEQQKILSGCKVLFSRIFPMGETNPHHHSLWQTCEKFGATCTNQIDENITHVVSNSLGTEKVKWAFSTGKFVVNPGWIEASAFLYNRANEKQFILRT